ncbi:MAG: hypothetical protein EBS07_09090 [Sphingobacteriia bacterium]|nr:hypothetical protein [Sphingobacteriia bacterium]
MKLKFYILWFSLGLVACKGFTGEKTDLSFIEQPVGANELVALIPIQPPLSGFMTLSDVCAGFDELLYVVDAGNEEIKSFDESGRLLGTLKLRGVTQVVQTRNLDLLAAGRLDTFINGSLYSLPTIYRIRLINGSLYGLAHAIIQNKVIHPLYFRTSVSATDTAVSFQDIGVLADNSYYVVRNGNNNAISQIGGPEDNILKFSGADVFLSPVNVQTQAGLYADYFRRPLSLATRAQPPQSPVINASGDFIVGMADPSAAFKLQYIRYISTNDGASYEVQTSFLTADYSKADGAAGQPNRFSRPVAVTITGDGSNLVFVADQDKDSVYQFLLNGLEGVTPPPGAESNRYVKISVGGTGSGLTQFRQPSALAWLNKTLYVADVGNGRVCRYKLSTDFR